MRFKTGGTLMLDNKKCGEEVECCEQEETLKPNCQQDDWEELEVECGDVFSAECVGILAEKIYDCVYLEHLQFADKDEEFIIDGFEDLSDDEFIVALEKGNVEEAEFQDRKSSCRERV